MVAATQVEVFSSGLMPFLFAFLFLVTLITACKVYLKIHNTIGVDGKGFFGVVTAILLIVWLILAGCSAFEIDGNSRAMLVRSGFEPGAAPITLLPKPLEVPVNLHFTPQMNIKPLQITAQKPIVTVEGE